MTGDLSNVSARMEFGAAAAALAVLAVAVQDSRGALLRDMAPRSAMGGDAEREERVLSALENGIRDLEMEERLLTSDDRTSPAAVTVVPGNHDRYVMGVEGQMEAAVRTLLGDTVATGSGKDGSGVSCNNLLYIVSLLSVTFALLVSH